MLKEFTTNGRSSGARDSWKESEAAINFWQALEYFAPQSPPAVKVEESVWEFEASVADHELPWNDPKKRLILDRQIGLNRKFQVFAGILGGSHFVEVARRYLDAEPIDFSEMRPVSPVACVVLTVNGEGMASGQVFVSTVPWAMSRIANSPSRSAALKFGGFFGLGGLEEQIGKKVQDLMVERRLLAKRPLEESHDDSATRAAGLVRPGHSHEAASADAEIGSRPEPPPLRPLTAQDVKAITDLVFELCGWHPEQQERWRIQALCGHQRKMQARKRRTQRRKTIR